MLGISARSHGRPTVPQYELNVSSLSNFILFQWLHRWS